MAKRFYALIAFFILAGSQLAQAEVIDFRRPVYTRIPIEEFSTPQTTFTSNQYIESVSVEREIDPYIQYERNGLQLLGETGSFTVTFDDPVSSVGVDLFLWNNARFQTGITEPTILTAHYFGNDQLNATSSIEVTTVPSSLVNYFAEGITKVVYSWDAGVVSYRDFQDNFYSEPGIIGIYALQNPYTQPIPEPETYAMMLAGLGLLGLARRKMKKA